MNVIERAAAIFRSGEVPESLEAVPCTCKHVRGNHAGARQRGACRDEGCACTRYRHDQAAYFAARANLAARSTLNLDLREYERMMRPQKAPGPEEISVRVSDVGECRKAIEYRNRPPEGFKRDPEDKRAAYIGTLIHDSTLARRRKLYPWRMYGDLKGMQLFLPGLDRPGRYDEFDPITGDLYDLKTAGTWRWNLVQDEGADEHWWEQLLLYGLALTLAGYTVTRLCIVVIERAGGKDEVFSKPFDIDEAYKVLNRLTTLSTAIELGIPQPRDRSGPTTDGICRNCFARSHCWQIPQATAAGRSPESWIKLGPTPEEKAVAAVVEEHVDAKAVQNQAKKIVEETKVLLDGVEPGIYGDFEGYPGGRTDTDWEEGYHQLLEILQKPQEDWPTTFPEPPKIKRSWTTWGRMRKATRVRIEKQREAAEKAMADRDARLEESTAV